jgi:hypothetical protein
LGEKKTLGDFILKAVVMTTLRHTTKKQTTPLSVVLELGSRIFSNARGSLSDTARNGNC